MRNMDNSSARKPANNRRFFYFLTGGLIAIGLIAGIFVMLSASRDAGAKPAALPITEGADAALVKAALAVAFHSTMDSSVGEIEKLSADSAHPPGNPYLLAVGTQAPEFTLQTLAGRSISLSDYRGKTVLLEFFATWCPHCQAEAKHLAELRAALPASKVAFLSVNADGEDAASVYAFDQFFAVSYPTLLDPGGRAGTFNNRGSAGRVTKSFYVHIYPTFYIIDRNGSVAWRSDGEQPDALLLKELTEISGK
jgi:peroxiredoxin